jgi:hypothetical protein
VTGIDCPWDDGMPGESPFPGTKDWWLKKVSLDNGGEGSGNEKEEDDTSKIGDFESGVCCDFSALAKRNHEVKERYSKLSATQKFMLIFTKKPLMTNAEITADAERTVNRLCGPGGCDDSFSEAEVRQFQETVRQVEQYVKLVIGPLSGGRMTSSSGSSATRVMTARSASVSNGVDDVINSALRPARAGSKDSRALQALKKK